VSSKVPESEPVEGNIGINVLKAQEVSWKMPETLILNAIKTTGLSLFQGLYSFRDVGGSEIKRESPSTAASRTADNELRC
jgi:hypothetical protein